MALTIPRLSYTDLKKIASDFISEHHNTGSIPVPVEQIVESGSGINIIPIPGLLEIHDVDALLSKDLKSLSVDMGVFEGRSPNRYRFPLAHELGHAVLHGDVFSQIPFSSIEEWKAQIMAISDRDYGWLEWQANSFAGLILVPPEPLKERLQEGLHMANEAGISVKETPEPAKDFICSWLGRRFQASSQVIERRLDKDEIWPPT